MTPSRTLPLAAAGLLARPVFTAAQAAGDDAKPAKAATPADETAATAVKKLSVAPGLQVDVWAAEAAAAKSGRVLLR